VLSLVLALVCLAPPASPAPEAAGSAQADGYGPEQARADIELILVDRGRAYLDARARLEDHPGSAATAVVARLEAVPAPGPDQRDRLLNVLAALQRPEHVGLFGEQLRLAMIQDRPTQLWLSLLRRQGDAAGPVLLELVGDRELGDEQRGAVLDVLVDVSGSERLTELLAMVGHGAGALQDRLRRALIRRAHSSTKDEQTIAAGLDAGLERTPEPARTAQLLILRAACCEPEPEFRRRIAGLIADPEAPFQVRVAAIDGLSRLGGGEGELEAVVRSQAADALKGKQAAEVLLALALAALPEDQGAELAVDLELHTAAAPRLASLAYRYGHPGGAQWLEDSQTHLWPEVRKAALERVAYRGPAQSTVTCDRALVRRLGTIGGPVSDGGEADARVGRSAVAALGRCGTEAAFAALRSLVHDTGIDLSQRGEAGKQLVLHDPAGPADVAEMLLDARFSDLARDLASALARAPEPTPEIRDALCRAAAGNPMVASTAHESFTALFPGQRCE